MCRDAEPSRADMPEYDMAGPMLIVIDAQTVRDDLEVLNSPVASIAAHFGDEFSRVRHTFMVPPAIPTRRGWLPATSSNSRHDSGPCYRSKTVAGVVYKPDQNRVVVTWQKDPE